MRMLQFFTQPLKTISLLVLLFLFFANSATASYLPVKLKGFNEDVIANGIGIPTISTTADADNSGYFFIDSTFKHSPTDSTSNYFLPSNRIIHSQSTPGNYFELAPYDNDNSLRLDQSNNFGELSFTVPQSAYSIYLLATSCNGTAHCDITVTFVDNTTITFNNRTIHDWYGGTPFAIQGIGRTFLTASDPLLNASNPRLYEINLPITSTLLIKKIAFDKTNTPNVLHIFGLSIEPRSPYCVSGSMANSENLDIGNVTFGNLNNGNATPPTFNNTAINSYSDFTNLAPENFIQGSTYLFSISKISKFGTSGYSDFVAYIDYNQDSVFDENYEKIAYGRIDNSSGVYHSDTNITIALTAMPGNTRMRVILSDYIESFEACGVYYNGETEDYKINVVAAPPCNGSSVAGNTTTSDSLVCVDSLFSIRLVGNTIASDITYQWQSSSDSLTWQNLSGANNTQLFTSITSTKFFRCISTCNNTALSDTSSVTKINLNPFYFCYCNSSASSLYNSTNIGNVTYGNLNNGILTTILNNASATNKYSDFRQLSPQQFMQGVTNSIAVTLITTSSNMTENRVSVYIDFNQDTVYDPISELVFTAISSKIPNGYILEGAITIPYNAIPGITGMRVNVNTNSYQTLNPCGDFYGGEIEDYLIEIMPAPLCNGVPTSGDAVSKLTDVCLGNKTDIHLKNVQITSGLTYQWQLSLDSLVWQNIVAATDTFLQTNQNTNTYYRCAISCGATNTAYSQSIKISMRPSTLCYCSNNLGGEPLPARNFIHQVNFLGTTLNNLSSASPFINGSSLSVYAPVGNTTCKVYRDSSFSLAVSSSGNMPISCWIDFDRNGQFDTYEWHFITAASVPGFMDTISFVVPHDAMPGLTGMRIRAGSDVFTHDSTSACVLFDGESAPGETEDYFITIQCINSPDNAGTILGDDSLAACVNQNSISYSVANIDNAEQYVWSLPSGATIIGNSDTNAIVVNFATNFIGGAISVMGRNNCGDGQTSSLYINFKPVPIAQICYITVDSATQNALLIWEKPIETYVKGYIIFKDIAGTFIALDTVSNSSFSSYLDTSSQTFLHPEKYKIVVLDSCGNNGDSSAVFEHKTIHLYGNILFGGIAKLYWNDYSGINDSNRYFNLLRDTTGNGPFNDTVAAAISPASYMNAIDITAANYANCRYVAKMISYNNCAPSLRVSNIQVNTIHSNIKNKIDLFDSVVWNSSLVNNLEHYSIQLFPNPAKNNFTVKNLNPKEDYYVQLYNTIGKSLVIYHTHQINHLEINVEKFSTGLYFVKIWNREKNQTFKLNIE
jgi:hypothetical protein